MTTLAADINLVREEGYLNDMPVIATDIIYQGAAVGDNGAGYARPLVAGDPFRGFARMQADNSTGAAGDINVNLLAEGRVVLSISGLAITDVGKAVYASDDATFTLTATSNSYIGRVIRWVSTGVGVVGYDVQDTIGIIAGVTDNTGGTANTTLVDGFTVTAFVADNGGGTADGTIESVAATTALTVSDGVGTNDGTIGAITADASVIAAVQELAAKINTIITWQTAVQNNFKELSSKTATIITDLSNQNDNDADLAGRINLIAQTLK